MRHEPKKILILELWGIGDAVMMTSVLAPLRQRFPTAEISVLVQEYGRELFAGDQDINHIFVFKFPWTAFKDKYSLWQWDWRGIFKTILTLRRERFDLLLDARGDPRNDLLARLIGPRAYWRPRQDRASLHRVDHWGALLQRAGIGGKGFRPRLIVREDAAIKGKGYIEDKFPNSGKILVGVHVGAAQRMRCWPLERFEQMVLALVEQVNIDILMFVEPGGYGKDAALRLGLPYFQGPLEELTAVVAQLDLLVCNDTGVMHIADALGVPLVAVFGPGDPSLIGPRGDAEIIIHDCEHRPCFDRCLRNTAYCLEAVTVDELTRAVLRQVKKRTEMPL